jgi:hypothetical protein
MCYGEGSGMSMSVELSTLVAQMSDEELERAYKELALDVAHCREKDRKKYTQLMVWQSFVVDEIWRRNHSNMIQDFHDKWKVKAEEYNGDTGRMYRENMTEMFNDIWRMVECL